ncbi:HIT family protein [Synechococcus sp. CCY 9618]|uniref:HIT family protein n=1 Tax=Synechococcus sp. CCY 9618 TaxID=2815602 RepID=UPI0020B4562C|nr:diadenosine tetraphosphate hydrolase [Synechococcus sp. CCY 9618]
MTSPSPAVEPDCPVCALHASDPLREAYQIVRHGPWLLRHHPDPAPLAGWLLLDSRRHIGGAADFDALECAGFGSMLQRSSALVRALAGCERVYAIAFGEGARHFHLHLIPRAAAEPASESWRIADLYRSVAAGERAPADPALVGDLVRRARPLAAAWLAADQS